MRPPPMPDRTPCKYCSKSGFVRREHVIKAGRAIASFYCGACNRSWEVVEEAAQSREDAKKHPSDKRRDDR